MRLTHIQSRWVHNCLQWWMTDADKGYLSMLAPSLYCVIVTRVSHGQSSAVDTPGALSFIYTLLIAVKGGEGLQF
jgi:hypothetical protein